MKAISRRNVDMGVIIAKNVTSKAKLAISFLNPNLNKTDIKINVAIWPTIVAEANLRRVLINFLTLLYIEPEDHSFEIPIGNDQHCFSM
jgi:hypothetical protein